MQAVVGLLHLLAGYCSLKAHDSQEAVRLREAFLEITGRQGAFTAEGVIDV